MSNDRRIILVRLFELFSSLIVATRGFIGRVYILVTANVAFLFVIVTTSLTLCMCRLHGRRTAGLIQLADMQSELYLTHTRQISIQE